MGHEMINARAETIVENRLFERLAPTDGVWYWGWILCGNDKGSPNRSIFAENCPFAVVGLWEHWEKVTGSAVDSCTLIMTAPNAIMEPCITGSRSYSILWTMPCG